MAIITTDSITTKKASGRKKEERMPMPKERRDKPSTLQKFLAFISTPP